jgi:hypothetical protein
MIAEPGRLVEVTDGGRDVLDEDRAFHGGFIICSRSGAGKKEQGDQHVTAIVCNRLDRSTDRFPIKPIDRVPPLAQDRSLTAL